MKLNKKIVLLVMFFSISLQGMAQYKAVITNLNTTEKLELKLNDEFYFGLQNSHEKMKGKLESISANALKIGEKAYPTSEISWIDSKGNKPKRNSNKIARVLLYFGAGLVTAGAYEYYEANDKKTATIVGGLGLTSLLGSFCFWIFPKQPQYDFTTKYLLEIQETK
jgi:hypothetical protein